jgi:hypothetical protein
MHEALDSISNTTKRGKKKTQEGSIVTFTKVTEMRGEKN